MTATLSKQGGRRYTQARSVAPLGAAQPQRNAGGGGAAPSNNNDYIIWARRHGRR